MDTHKLTVTIITQEKELSSSVADAVSAPTTEGVITVLPGHIPLFSRLQTGEVILKSGKEEESFVVSKGFIDVAPENKITILVDSAVEARAISREKAEEAVEAAHHTMSTSQNQEELIAAEASLRRALLEIKVSEKSKRNRI